MSMYRMLVFDTGSSERMKSPCNWHYFYLIFAAGTVGLSEPSAPSNHLKQRSMYEISSADSLDVGDQAELPSPGTDKHLTYARVVEEKDKSQSETSPIQKASTNLESVQKTSRTHSNLFSSKLLNSCIIASERTRGLCALVIAFCVLLSHINLPLLGYSIGRSDSNVTSKPLYIILLTDITVVLTRMFLDKKGVVVSRESEEEKTGAPQDNKENWDVTVMLLERGLVAYRTIRAVFTDFSIYAVVQKQNWKQHINKRMILPFIKKKHFF